MCCFFAHMFPCMQRDEDLRIRVMVRSEVPTTLIMAICLWFGITQCTVVSAGTCCLLLPWIFKQRVFAETPISVSQTVRHNTRKDHNLKGKCLNKQTAKNKIIWPLYLPIPYIFVPGSSFFSLFSVYRYSSLYLLPFLFISLWQTEAYVGLCCIC
jgi:hypothetical protein